MFLPQKWVMAPDHKVVGLILFCAPLPFAVFTTHDYKRSIEAVGGKTSRTEHFRGQGSIASVPMATDGEDGQFLISPHSLRVSKIIYPFDLESRDPFRFQVQRYLLTINISGASL